MHFGDGSCPARGRGGLATAGKRDPIMAARRGDQAQGLQDGLQPRSDWTHPSLNPARPALPLSSLFVFVAFPDLSRTRVETMEEVGHADSASLAQ